MIYNPNTDNDKIGCMITMIVNLFPQEVELRDFSLLKNLSNESLDSWMDVIYSSKCDKLMDEFLWERI